MTKMPFDTAQKLSQLMSDRERYMKEKDPHYEPYEFRPFLNHIDPERSGITVHDSEGYKVGTWRLPVPDLDALAKGTYDLNSRSFDESHLRKTIREAISEREFGHFNDFL
jgi:hypothetical protein